MTDNGAGTGFLVVQVYTAEQTLPIADAHVLITQSSTDGETLVKVLKTNRSGKTDTVSLSAPPKKNSLMPDPDGSPYYTYNIRVDYPGYYTTENLDVPIFDEQTSIQPIAMIPLPADEERGKRVTVRERDPNL